MVRTDLDTSVTELNRRLLFDKFMTAQLAYKVAVEVGSDDSAIIIQLDFKYETEKVLFELKNDDEEMYKEAKYIQNHSDITGIQLVSQHNLDKIDELFSEILPKVFEEELSIQKGYQLIRNWGLYNLHSPIIMLSHMGQLSENYDKDHGYAFKGPLKQRYFVNPYKGWVISGHKWVHR